MALKPSDPLVQRSAALMRLKITWLELHNVVNSKSGWCDSSVLMRILYDRFQVCTYIKVIQIFQTSPILQQRGRARSHKYDKLESVQSRFHIEECSVCARRCSPILNARVYTLYNLLICADHLLVLVFYPSVSTDLLFEQLGYLKRETKII